MTQEMQKEILSNHYEGCLNLWKREGKDEITAWVGNMPARRNVPLLCTVVTGSRWKKI